MKKEDVVWHEEDETEVMKDPDGWTLVCLINHFKNKFWYEIKAPDGYYLDYMSEDIYETIDKINEVKKTYVI